MSNVIKVRDDHDPVEMTFSDNKFCAVSESGSSDTTFFSIDDMRKRIEPWLTSLFQSEHLSLLVGSGLSTAVQYIAAERQDNAMAGEDVFESFKEEIKESARFSAEQTGRKVANVEDFFRVASDLLRGLSILICSDNYSNLVAKYDELQNEYENRIKLFADSILGIENSILNAGESNKQLAINTLVLFLLSFASRTGTRDRLNIFTTNYDRIIEMASDYAGIRLIDRFVGTLSPLFRSSRLDTDLIYNPPGMRGEPRYLEGVARFTKLHGSLDWIDYEREIIRIPVPFGADCLNPYLPTKDKRYSKVMIFPNSSKDRETSEYPYVDLFRDYAAALCRPNSTLVTYGYSFGDDHINRVIRDMLSIPSTHLVIISYDDANGRIMDKFKVWGKQSQMSLLIGKEVASLQSLVKYYLPKPSIDTATIRMVNMLKQRNDGSGDGTDHDTEVAE